MTIIVAIIYIISHSFVNADKNEIREEKKFLSPQVESK